MAKILCFPKISTFHAARDRTFFIDLSESKGEPFYIVAFTFHHESHDYYGRPNNQYHYSTFHYYNGTKEKHILSDVRHSIVHGIPLTEQQLADLDKHMTSTSLPGPSVSSHLFSVTNLSELEEAISLMEETRPLENDEQVRATILKYVSPFLESTPKNIVFPQILL